MKATLIRLIAPALIPLFLIPALGLLLPESGITGLLGSLLTGLAVMATLAWRIQKHFIKPARIFRRHLQSLKQEPIDFSKTLDLATSPDWEGCSRHFNQLLEELDDIFTQVLGSSARLIPMSQELTDTYSAILQKNLLQSSHGQVLIGAISRMIEQAERLRVDLEQITAAAQHAEQDMSESREATLIVINGVTDVASMLEEATRDVRALAQASGNIGGILSSIKDIADQTNLLALNAAIEAARAGESGRGFAVVADEVRKLAHRTQEATQQVQHIMGDVQRGTEKVVGAMTTSLERAGFAATHADTSREKLNNITRSISEINASASEIGNAVSMQAQAVHDSKSSGDILIQLNQDALDCSRIHAVSPEDLRNLAAKLRSSLARLHMHEKQWNDQRRTRARPSELQLAGGGSSGGSDTGDIELF